MLSKLTNSPAKAALLLSESSKYKDLLDMNNEVIFHLIILDIINFCSG